MEEIHDMLEQSDGIVSGMNKTLSLLKERVIIAGGYVSGRIGIKTPLNGNPIDGETTSKINTITRKFIKNIEKHKKPLFERFYTYIAINVFFKPFVMKHQDHYEYVIKSWKSKGLMKSLKSKEAFPKTEVLGKPPL
jgi:hypothetical protein